MTFFKEKYGMGSLTVGLVFGLVAFFLMGCANPAGPGSEPDARAPVEPQVVNPDSPVSSDDPAPTPTSPPALPEGEVTTNLAPVDNIDILILESFPVQGSR